MAALYIWTHPSGVSVTPRSLYEQLSCVAVPVFCNAALTAALSRRVFGGRHPEPGHQCQRRIDTPHFRRSKFPQFLFGAAA